MAKAECLAASSPYTAQVAPHQLCLSQMADMQDYTKQQASAYRFFRLCVYHTRYPEGNAPRIFAGHHRVSGSYT